MTENKTHSHTPSEEQIEILLRMIKPNPGIRFHKKMENQPWNRNRRNLFGAGFKLRTLPATLIVSLIFIILISLASPSLEVLANRISQFFSLSSGDHITIEIPAEDLVNPDAEFSLTVYDAKGLAGYPLYISNAKLDNYHFTGAAYDGVRKAVILNFTTESGDQILRFSQRPIGVEYQGISANAKVESVKIGSLNGEYVMGGWKIVEANLEPEKSTPTTHQAIWETDNSIQYLRWQANDMVFEIFFSGVNPDTPGFLNKSDLIALAEDLQ